ncbi:hypothetical protein MNBD_GAMMA12-1839 [hydrothermal vent metagenome]|uniref:Uncharacterized protein n=1 Tax=hydrothermal vent metagenome TaxID=652676 RepID=A0A3B0YLN7_9ZZZZ
MQHFFSNYHKQYPWHRTGMFAVLISIWLFLYQQYLIAAPLSVAILFIYLLVAKSINKKLALKRTLILKNLEVDSSDIIRNIVASDDNKQTEENQFNHLIAKLLEQYPRTSDIPFYFFIDSDSDSAGAGIDHLLQKSGLVSIVDPGIDSKLKVCQSNVDHYYFDWWFTSKGVMIDLSVLLDGRVSDEFNAGLVQIENLIKFVKQFGDNTIQGIIYSVNADTLNSENDYLLSCKLPQLETISQSISKNVAGTLDYNLLVQSSQDISGFNEFARVYSETGNFSPIGVQIQGNVDKGLMQFVDSLNAFVLLMLQKNNTQLRDLQSSGFVNNVDQLRPSILKITESVSKVSGQSQCKGVYFVDIGQAITSDLRDPNSQYVNSEAGQSTSAALRMMLSNVTQKLQRNSFASKLLGVVSLSLLLGGLSILSYMFINSYANIRSMDRIPTRSEVSESQQKEKNSSALIDKATRLIAYSVSKLVITPRKGPIPDSRPGGKKPGKAPKISQAKLTFSGEKLHHYLLGVVYNTIGEKSLLPVLEQSHSALAPFLESVKDMQIPFKYTNRGYLVVRLQLDKIIPAYLARSKKVRKDNGLKPLNGQVLRNNILALHINAHVNQWRRLLKVIKFKAVSSRQNAAKFLKVLVVKQEFSIYLKTLADHHLPSYNHPDVDKFKAYLENIESNYHHLKLMTALSGSILNSKKDKLSRKTLAEIKISSQNNSLQQSYLADFEKSVLSILMSGKVKEPTVVAANDGSKATTKKVVTTAVVTPTKIVDPKIAGTKAVDPKIVGTKAVGTKAVGTKAVGTKAVDPKIVGTKVVDPKIVGSKAVGTKAVDPKIAGTKAVDPKIVGTKAVDPNPSGPASIDPDTSQASQVAQSDEIRAKLVADWNNNIYKFCGRKISRRYPVNYNARSLVKIVDFNKYFGWRGQVQAFYKNKLKPYIVVNRRRAYRWNEAGKALKLGNRLLRHIEAVQTIRRLWYKRGYLALTVRLRPELLSSGAARFGMTIGKSYIEYETRDRKQYSAMQWTSRGTAWRAKYVFILRNQNQNHDHDQNHRNDTREGRFPNNKWFWVRLMNRTLRGRSGLVAVLDGRLKMLFHLERGEKIIRQFRVINRYRCFKL